MPHMELEQLYRTYRKTLRSVAYRILGTVSDAEDIVQELFASLQTADLEHVDNLKSYLVKTTVNRCLNLLKSARRRRELYTGPWLPEPQISPAEHDPLEQVVQEEAVSYAFLVLLQRLSPMERAAFVLREVLGYEYAEIGSMLDRTEANCRKMYSRAKLKLRQGTDPSPEQIRDAALLAESFLQAARTGNFAEFVRSLTEDAVLVSDGGGKRRAAMRLIYGRERIQALFEGIGAKGAFRGEWRILSINGQQGLVLVRGGVTEMAVCFAMDFRHPKAAGVYLILNPDKLQPISFD